MGIHRVRHRDPVFNLPTGPIRQVARRLSWTQTRQSLPSLWQQRLASGQLLESLWENLRQPVLRLDRATELEHMVHGGINTERVNNGGLPLKRDDQPAVVARSHSDDMIRRDDFGHDTPEGPGPSDRANRGGYACRKRSHHDIAENIWMLRSSVPMGASSTALDRLAAQAVESWMESPGHRTNLLSQRVDRTGVGASFGPWRGSLAVILTQVFC